MAEEVARMSTSSASDEDEFHVYRLRIHDASLDDAGKWTCEVEDKYGKVSTVCDVAILEELKRQAKAAVEEANMSRAAQQKTKTTTSSHTSSSMTSSSKTTIQNGVKEEEKSEFFHFSKGGDLDALVFEEEPTFSRTLRNTKVQQGRNFKLECRAAGNPMPELKWYKNNLPIQTDIRHSVMVHSDGISTLEVKDAVRKYDNAVYRCEAISFLGIATTESKVTVLDEEAYEKWDQLNKLDEVEFEPYDIQRRFLTSTGKNQIEDDSVVDKRLMALKSDESHLQQLYKQQNEAILKLSAQWDETRSFFFREHLKSKCVVEGASALLTCFVSGIPPFFVQWYKDNAPLYANIYERYYIRLRGGHFSLEIPLTSLDDTGEYSVEVRNEQGHIISTCYLQVEPTLDPCIEYCRPYFTKNIHHTHAEFGGTAIFSCIVKGNPKPNVTWYKDGRRIHQTNKVTMHFGEKGLVILKIHECQHSDIGLYKCQAHSMAGRCQSSAKLVVFGDGTPSFGSWGHKDTKAVDSGPLALSEYTGDSDFVPLNTRDVLYQPPRLCKSLPETMKVKEWQMLFFECKVEGFPKPTVTWLCNGEELTNKGHVKIIAVKNYHSCEIARAYAERDIGKYTVRLTHPSGSVIESSCMVEIQQEISILSELKERKKSDLVLEREARAEQLAAKYAKKTESSSKTETKESVTVEETKTETVSAAVKTAEETATKVVEEAVAEAAAAVSKEVAEEPAPAPAAEPVPAPVESAPKPAAEPVAEPAPEPTPKPVATETAPEAAPAPAAEPVAAAPEPKAAEPKEAETKAAEPEPEPKAAEPAPEPKAAEPEAAPEPTPVAEPVAEEAPKPETAPEVAKEDTVDAAPQPEPCEPSVPQEKEPAYVSPDFVTKLEKEYHCLDSDTNIKIQCQVEGKPRPEVSWVKDNKKLSPSDNLTIEWSEDTGIATLWFKSLMIKDSGKYTCIASSSAGTCSCTTSFTVDKPKKAPTVKKALDKEYSFVTTDTKATLQCQVEGHPVPDIIWKKDGKILVSGSKHGLEWDAASGKATLKFKSLIEADSGCYECSASSSAGSVSCSTNVAVKKPEKKPTVVEGLKKEYSFVETTETVRLQCKMEGNPCPEVSWTKDGKALEATETLTFEWDAKTGVAALVFKGVSVSNTGKYECVATSKVGTIKSATTMTVKEPERTPLVVEPLNKEYNALETDENVCLKCKVDGNPVPEISWTKDGKKLSASENVKMDWDAATCTASLTFKHPKASDSGNYECVAKSSAGTTNSPTKLAIKKIPTIQKPLNKTYTSVEGAESLRLECHVDGFPSPRVTWLKNEKEVVIGDNIAMEWNPDTGSAALVFKQPTCEDSGDYQCVAISSVGTTNSPTTLTVKKPEKAPSVVEQLDNVYECKEGGDSVRLTCRMEGNPSPAITWLKDGKEVVIGNNIAMEWNPDTGSAALVFKQPTCEDSGDYQCVATSSVGTTNSHTTLTVKKVPTVVEPLNKAYEPVEGDQNVRLVCKLGGTPAPEVTWLKDGKKVTPGDNVAMEWDPDTGSAALVFKQPTCEDSGDYQCVATSSVGTTNSHTKLTVKKVPTVVEPLKKAYEPVEGDQNVRLVCKLGGTPAPEVTWLKDGKKVTPGDNVAMEWDPDTGSAALVFKQPTCEDSGDYQCVATSSVGTTNSHTTLTVKKVPIVVEPLNKAYEPVEGDLNVRLVCKLGGTPAPEVTWLKGGKKVTPGDNVAMEWDPDTGSAALVFKQPTCEDSGDYQCVATSSVGTTNSHTKLTVKKIPTVIEPLEKTYDSIEGSDQVTLVCKVAGTPCPEICWLKDGQKVKSSDNVSMERDAVNGSAALVFKQPTCEDSGDYQCVATSSVGTTNSQTTLTVKKKTKAPGVIRPLDSAYNSTEGEEVIRLVCELDGNPTPDITWLKDGKEVTPGDNVAMEWDPDTGSAALVFKQPTCEDSGDYQCVATSSVGTTNSHTTLTVKKVPTVVEPLNKAYEPVEGDQNVRLVCKLGGTPAPEVTWLKDGKKVTPGDNVAMEWDPDTGSAALVFKQPTCEDSGDYQCVATSSVGTTNSHTTLTVKKVPTVVEPLNKAYEPVEGDLNVRLVCKLGGTPAPEVTWLKDGKKVTPGDNVAMEWDPDTGSAALVFKQPTCEDSGDYQCVATSSVGTTNSHTKLTVKKIPTVIEPLEKTYDSIEGSDRVTLVCKIAGTPCPEICWLKDGQKVKSDDNVAMEWDPDTGSAALVFKQPTCEDSGDYQCVATSSVGTTNSHTTLTVKKKTKAPGVVRPLDSAYNSTEGDNVVRLVCEVDGNPTPDITWLKDGKEVSPGDNVAMEWNPDTCSAALVFKQPTCEDSGDYQCVATSSVGTTNSHTTLTVKKPPTINKPLEKIYTCKEGRDKNVRLVCTVTGKPSPEVSWSKGGKKIKSSESIKIEWDATTGSAALVFKQPTCQDSGDYQCMASSPLGSTSTSTTLKVKKPEKKPAVVKPLDKEYNLTETKETISLTFKVDGNPVPEVSWLKDGKPLEASGNVSFDWNAETGSASLIFKGVSVKDSGKYECVATSTIGKTTSSTTIVVKKPEKKPTFSTPLPKENNKREGDENFVLTCTVEGNPRPEVSWVKNGEKLATDNNTSVKYDAEKGIATLTFKVLSCADSGNYECVAVSSAGTGKSTANLAVKMPEIKPKFSKDLDEAYNVLVGDKNVKMACVVDGNPCPDVSWFKAGKKEKLMETSNMKMKWTPSTGHAALIFNSVSLSDAGTYVCVADSAIGSKKCETSLKVTKPVCPPVFTDMAASQTVPVGGVAVFKCIVTSKSPASFTWKKGNDVLSNTDRIKISVSQTETSLTITGVQFDDRATYTCSAKNEDGEEHTSGDLNVEEKGVKGRWTPFEERPSKYIAGDEDDVFLPEVQKPKDSYTWDTYVKDITILAEGYPIVIEETAGQDKVDGAVESKVSESVKVAETKSEVTATQEVKETKEGVKVVQAKSESVSKQEVSVKKEGAKVTQVTSSESAEESTVQVLEELESSVTKLNETLSQSQETSVASTTTDSRIQIVEVKARHVAKETTDSAGQVRHRHHEHHGPEVIIPANSAAIPEHSEVELMVKVRAAKQANVRWMHEGEIVQQSGHYEMLEEEELIKK